MDVTKKHTIPFVFLRLAVSIFISLNNEVAHKKSYTVGDFSHSVSFHPKLEVNPKHGGLDHHSRATFKELFKEKPDIVSAFIRLAFYECFVHDCDASILLEFDKSTSEQSAPPNLSVRGFREIETIKSRLEKTCPGVVSCADIVVLADKKVWLLSVVHFILLKLVGGTAALLREASQLPRPTLMTMQRFSHLHQKDLIKES